MTRIAAVHPVLPGNVYDQATLTEGFADLCLPGDSTAPVLRRFHSNAKVGTRYLALPIEAYPTLTDFTAANNAYIKAAVDLGSQAILGALDEAGLHPDDVDLVISTTVTGVAVPSIEARIAAQIGLRPDVRRLPLFGLGCVAGAAGLARLHDFLRGSPRAVGVLVAVELCSLTLQRDDSSTANLVASGLFGDGAAAVVAVGAERLASGPEVVDSRSRLYPGTERAMGWDVGSWGMKIVLGAEIPDLVQTYLADDVTQFLKEHDLTIPDIAFWVAHPGGPRVLTAMQSALQLDDQALGVTWRSLDRIGNMSSASVLHVLRDTLDQPRPPLGAPGVLLAMGPGFCSELVLLRW